MLQREQRVRECSDADRAGWRAQETYLFQAALAELKSSYQIRARNDSVVLRSLTASLQRDTDSISQRLKEDTASLRSSIQVRSKQVVHLCGLTCALRSQLELHVRKEESNADLKALDRAIMVRLPLHRSGRSSCSHYVSSSPGPQLEIHHLAG